MEAKCLLAESVLTTLQQCRYTLERYGELRRNLNIFWGRDGKVGGQCCIGAVRVYQKLKKILPGIKIAWNSEHCFNIVRIGGIRYVIDITATQFNSIRSMPKVLIVKEKQIVGQVIYNSRDMYLRERIFHDEISFYHFLKQEGWPKSQMPFIKKV